MKKWINWSLLVCVSVINCQFVQAVLPTEKTEADRQTFWAIRTRNILEWREAVRIVREKLDRREQVEFPYEFAWTDQGHWRFAIDYDSSTQQYMEVTIKDGVVKKRSPHYNAFTAIPETDDSQTTGGNENEK